MLTLILTGLITPAAIACACAIAQAEVRPDPTPQRHETNVATLPSWWERT